MNKETMNTFEPTDKMVDYFVEAIKKTLERKRSIDGLNQTIANMEFNEEILVKVLDKLPLDSEERKKVMEYQLKKMQESKKNTHSFNEITCVNPQTYRREINNAQSLEK